VSNIVTVDDTSVDIVDSVVRGFTEFSTQVDFEDIGDAAIRAAKRCLLDAIGCALGAHGTSVINALQSVAAAATNVRPATIFGTAIQTTPDLAALVNGSMIRCLDFSDDYFGTNESNAQGNNGPHPSDNLGGVLAAAQIAGADGKSTLLGIVIAYEVCGQLVDEVILRSNGWDYTIFHAVATSAAASRLLGLDADQTANAIRLAVVPNLAVHETRIGTLSNWKGMAGPNGSRNGFFAALLAEAGVTGPELAFEGAQGFMRQVNHTFSLGPFGGNGRPFRIENTYFKHLPMRYEMQLPVQMAMELRKTVDPFAITKLHVHMEKKSVASRELQPALWRPTTAETADHSGPYLIATALVHGKVDESSFETQSLSDPAVLQVIDTIELIEDPDCTAAFPWPMLCRFEIELVSGESLTVVGENPKGHPLNPMSDNDLAAKFHTQVQPRLGSGRAEELLQTIWRLEQEPSLGRLFDLMVVRAD
jgi:2-methylcitrate dehydratase